MEMQTTMLLDKNSPKIRKNEHIRQTKSPAHHETVIAHMISSGIKKKVTWKLRKYRVRQEYWTPLTTIGGSILLMHPVYRN